MKQNISPSVITPRWHLYPCAIASNLTLNSPKINETTRTNAIFCRLQNGFQMNFRSLLPLNLFYVIRQHNFFTPRKIVSPSMSARSKYISVTMLRVRLGQMRLWFCIFISCCKPCSCVGSQPEIAILKNFFISLLHLFAWNTITTIGNNYHRRHFWRLHARYK